LKGTPNNPIIIVGAGRTGSTIFHSMLSKHPGLAWLPGGVCNRFPDNPALSRLSLRLIDYPVIGELAKRKIKPAECYPFWEHHCRGFSAPYRDLMASDVTENARTRVQATMSKIRTDSRDRLLIKITGWPRIGFLSEIFKNAKFVHVMRDGRAVANSMVNVHFWRGWSGPQDWGWGELSPAQEEEWNKYDQSFVVLAAIQWKILMDAMESAKNLVNDDKFIEIKYEDFCSDPTNTFKNVAAFCDLEWTPGFEKGLRGSRVRNTNDKYRSDLTAKQQKDLEEVLGDYLARYGYL
jgi:omega-hydroxy-beta-dihydromenaquinone-9 sulfotransferase